MLDVNCINMWKQGASLPMRITLGQKMTTKTYNYVYLTL